MAFKLYELTQQYQEILNLINEYETDDPAILDTLEAIDDAIDDKLTSAAYIIKTLQAESKALKDEEDRLAKRRKVRDNNAARLKEYIQNALEATGRTKIDGGSITLRLQNNPPSVLIRDDKAIPGHYLIERQPDIDKKGILADLKEGIEVEGAELKQGKSLRIQ